MSFHHSIPCPDCGSDILIESTQLLSGGSFRCTNANCTVAISLDDPKSVSTVTSAFEKFEKLKEESLSQAQNTE